MNPLHETLKSEVERLFTLTELNSIMTQYLELDPAVLGSEGTGKAARVGKLFDVCEKEGLIEALADVVLGLKGKMVDPRVAQIMRSLPPFEPVRDSFDPDWTIGREIGRGGFGAVFDATGKDGASRCAVKFIRPDMAGNRQSRIRWLAYQRLLARRALPGLPEIRKVGVTRDGVPFVAYALIEGKSLADLIGEQGLGFEASRAILVAVLELLGAMHAQGAAYGDLRPSKVIVSGDSETRKVTLLLPGNSRQLWRPGADIQHTLLLPGGAPAWQAPEQIRGDEVDARADVYQFGLLACRTVTGLMPFQARNPIEMIVAQLQAEPRLPSALRPQAEIPERFDKMVARCLNKEPARRFPDVASLRSDLDALYGAWHESREAAQHVRPATVDEFEDMAGEFLQDPEVEELMEETIALARGSKSWVRLIEILNQAVGKVEDAQVQKLILTRLAGIYRKDIKDHDEAAGCFRRILEIDPQDAGASALLEDSLREARQWEALADLFLDRVTMTDDPALREKLFIEIARIYERELDQGDNALLVLLPLLQSDPGNQQLVESVTRIARQTGRWDEVIATANKVIDQPGEPEKAVKLLVLMARWYLEEMGRADFSLPCYQKALTIAPNDAAALEGLEALLRTQSAWQDLAGVLKRRVQVVSSPAAKRDLKADLASIHAAHLDDQASAAELYSEILDEDHTHEEAFGAMEKILTKQEKWADLARIMEARANAVTDQAVRRTAWYILAEMYEARLGDLTKATTFHELVLTVQPDSMPSLKALEVIHAQTGDTKALSSVLERQCSCVTTPKQRLDLLMRRAAIHEEEFLDDASALALIDEALGIDRRHGPALLMKGRLLKKLSRWEDLLLVLQDQLAAEEDGKRKAELLQTMATLLAERFGKFSESADALVQAFELSGSSNLEIVDLVIESCEKAQRWNDAVQWLERAAEKEDGERRATRLIAAGELLEQKLGERDEAIRRYRRALDAHPANVKAAAAMRTTFTSRGDHGAALEMLRKEIDATEGNLKKARLYAEMGRTARNDLQDPERAIEYYEKAHELDPTRVDAGEPLAELYRLKGSWDKALKIFEQFAASAEAMEPQKAAELFFRFGEASLRRNDLEGAKKALERARDFDPRDTRILRMMADVAFERKDWDKSSALYDDFLLRLGDEVPGEDRVNILLRQAKSAEAQEDHRKCVEMLGKVIEADPGNREALEMRARIHEQRAEWQAAVDDMRAFMNLGVDEDRRFELLVHIADLLKDKLGESEKAAKSLQAALEVRQDDRATLLKLMQINMGLERWGKVVEVVLKLADLVQDKRELATYYKTAATLNDHYLDRKDDALTYYELALDNDPGQLKLFDSMVTILVGKQDWKSLEKAYQKMTDRLPGGVEASTRANLWHSLGEVYQHRLGQHADAINAYETALELDSTQRSWQEVLADLYADNLRFSEKALRLNREILQLNPYRTNSYRMLYRIYRKKAKYDEAWCIADSLHSLNMADDEEMELYQAYATEEPAAAQERVSDEIWGRYLMHPMLDDKITGIFRIIEPTVIKAKASSSSRANLREEDRVDAGDQHELMPRTFHYAAGVLGMDLPPFYLLRSDRDTGIVFAPTWPPAIAVGGAAIEEEDPQMLAFVAGRHLAYYMPGLQLRVFLQSGTALSAWVLAAIKSVVTQFPVPEDFKSKVTDAVGILRKGLTAGDQEMLAARVMTFLESATGGIDLKRWASAVDFTADRAGLLLSTEMKVATSVIKNMPVDSWMAPTKERLTELSLFSVSEDYFVLRSKLGIAIQTE